MSPTNIKIVGTPKKAFDSFSIDSGVAMTPASPISPVVISSAGVPRGNLVMPADAVVIFHGITYNSSAVQDMALKLRRSRSAGEFPAMRGDYRDVRDIIDDYNTFARLRTLRGETPRAEWPSIPGHDETLVNAARDISEREDLYRERDSSANVFNRVSTMMQGVEMEDRLRQIVTQACKNAVSNGNVQARSPSLSGVDLAAVLNDIRNDLHRQSSTGANGVNAVNMDAVFKEVFSILERGILDATGPMRLNNHTFRQHNDILGQNNAAISETSTALRQNNEALTMQVNAITTLAQGIAAHVSGLGSHVSAMNINMGAVNTNLTATGTQVQHIQTLLNEVPQMVNDAVNQSLQNVLPQLFDTCLSPIYRDVQATNESRRNLKPTSCCSANIKAKTKKRSLISRILKIFK